MKILNQGFDHFEFVVKDPAQHTPIWSRMGFEKVGEAHLKDRGLKTQVWAQGRIRAKLVTPDGSQASQDQLTTHFHQNHGDGISVLALEVDDAKAAFEETVARGARPAMKPARFESPQGTVIRSEIYTPSDLRYAFIQRDGNLFDEGVPVTRMESPSPFGLTVIDHLTNNVGIGQMKTWVDYYKSVFQFKVTRHFEITTGRTGLVSDVVQNDDARIKVPINEATEPESQVQEFVERFHGVGVQHLALATTDIVDTLKKLRSKTEFKFLDVPSTYYEMVPKRVPDFTEDLKLLEDLKILLDGEGGGYLLQIFTGEVVGPFFFEFIQRKGNNGFGEGNFKALFEAIERDQVKRGVLK